MGAPLTELEAEMLAALRDALELAKTAGDLTGCRGDDDYVWGLEAKFKRLIAMAEARATGSAPAPDADPLIIRDESSMLD